VRAYGGLPRPTVQADLLTMKQPVGPVPAITPWNFPLAMATRKIGPAIAAGCTMVLKPAAQTPLSALAFARDGARRACPTACSNVVRRRSAGALVEPLLADARLRKLSFTGSTPVGKRLVAQAAENLQRVSMELGGNAPFLVFADADLDAAVDGAVLAKMRNIGEACTAANRFLVHESVAEDFARAWRAARGDAVGRGTERARHQGRPAHHREARATTCTPSSTDAVEGGARGAVTGGERLDGPGAFYAPTVLAGVRAGARLQQEEIFNPGRPGHPFSDDDEAVAWPTTPSTAWCPTCTPATCPGRSGPPSGSSLGHGRAQPGRRVQPRRPRSAGQGQRVRPRGRRRGHRGVPRHQVRRASPQAGLLGGVDPVAGAPECAPHATCRAVAGCGLDPSSQRRHTSSKPCQVPGLTDDDLVVGQSGRDVQQRSSWRGDP
jgi:hypothetical protein